MKFITIRDFRSKSAKIQKDLPEQKEMILTSNGKPIAIVTAVSENNLEESLNAIRRAKALYAITQIQSKSLSAGKDKVTLDEINKEIESVRGKRKKK